MRPAAAEHRRDDLDLPQLLRLAGERIAVEDDEVGEAARDERSAATFVVRWLGAVKMFDMALAATNGGPGNATNVINLYIYEQAFRSLHFAEASAMTVIVLAGTIVITLGMLWGSRKLEDLN